MVDVFIMKLQLVYFRWKATCWILKNLRPQNEVILCSKHKLCLILPSLCWKTCCQINAAHVLLFLRFVGFFHFSLLVSNIYEDPLQHIEDQNPILPYWYQVIWLHLFSVKHLLFLAHGDNIGNVLAPDLLFFLQYLDHIPTNTLSCKQQFILSSIKMGSYYSHITLRQAQTAQILGYFDYSAVPHSSPWCASTLGVCSSELYMPVGISVWDLDSVSMLTHTAIF